MRYEGICCGTCGWFSKEEVRAVDGGDCHHSLGLIGDACASRHKDWWCENWISEHHAKEHFYLKGEYEILDKCADERSEP